MAGFVFVPVASPLHDAHVLHAILSGLSGPLRRVGGRPVTEDGTPGTDPLLYLILTGGTERRLLELWERRVERDPGEPAFLIAHPGQNSLPAALEALARVHQLAGRGRILPLAGPDDDSGAGRIAAAAKDLEARMRLRETRLGLIGEPSDWLVASSPSADVVRKTWGPQVVRVDIRAAIARYMASPAAHGRSLASSGSAARRLLWNPPEQE